MAKEILYTTAVDDKGVLVHINDAEKDKTYYCPSCKKEFILRKSGKTGKGSRRPHFAHNELTPSCTPESALHYSFKKKLVDLLNEFLSEKRKLIINWNCIDCSDDNTGNLLSKVTSVIEEYNLTVCQPDISLLDAEKKVIAVIEIVVTHKPDEKVLQYYKDNCIVLLQLNLSSDEDLKYIERKVTTPDLVDYCLNPACSNTTHSYDRKIHSYVDRCNRCCSPIEKFRIEINSSFGILRTLNFTDNEINLVKSKSDNIQVISNQSKKQNYPATICNSCRIIRSRVTGNRRL